MLSHIRRRLRGDESGFTLIESAVALGVIFASLVVMGQVVASGFNHIGTARQRVGANQIANKILEQVRGLSYERIAQGLASEDNLPQDPRIKTCPDGLYYYDTCPEQNANSEKIVHTSALPSEVPLVPHKRTVGPPDYPTTYTSRVYVTMAKNVPVAGAYRVTVGVSWDNPLYSGTSSLVTSQSLIYTPKGTTDPGTGVGSDAPFFYGTGSLSRGSVKVTPNEGVSGGTGVTGLSSWDEVSEELYGLDANVQAQSLTQAEGKSILTAGTKVVGGVGTTSGGVTASTFADDDPATPAAGAEGPLPLSHSAVSASVAGGGNSVGVLAASVGGGGPQCPPGQPNLRWISGMETGTATATPFGEAIATAGAPTADAAVKRTGAYSLKVTQTAGGAVTGKGEAVFPPAPVVVGHLAIRLASLPTADVTALAEIIGIGDPNTRLQLGYKASTNRFRLMWFGGTGQVQSTMTVSAGTWYVIDILFDGTTSPDTASWMIDGIAQPPTTAPSGVDTEGVFFWLGAVDSTATFTANYDDMAYSTSSNDYPLPDLRVGRLLPNGMGPGYGNPGSNLLNNGNSAINADTWTRLDEVPMTSVTDYVLQANNATSNYVEVSFEDTAESCILGVRAFANLGKSGNATTHGRTEMLQGSQTTTLNNADHPTTAGSHYSRMVATEGDAAWTTSNVNGLTARFGYSSDANPDPYWYSFQLAVAYVPPTEVDPGEDVEGPAGIETGSTTSTTAASAGAVCGNPVQLDARACSYAKQSYSTSGTPFLASRINLAGSGGGKCDLYKFLPATGSGATSYAWGRRAPGTGGAGTVKESVVRYPGAHELGALCTAAGAGPSGWPGYWVKYDAGVLPASVHAEAGVGSTAPTYTNAGTISYWNGTGMSAMTPPPGGGEIPVAPLDHTSGGLRIEISGTLNSAPSFTSQQPPGAVGTAERTEGRSVLGAPVIGEFTYKVTNVATGAVIANVTVSVDLGTLTAVARYSA